MPYKYRVITKLDDTEESETETQSFDIHLCASLPNSLGFIVEFVVHTFLDTDMELWAIVRPAIRNYATFTKVETTEISSTSQVQVRSMNDS
jgi:hypothetical protein